MIPFTLRYNDDCGVLQRGTLLLVVGEIIHMWPPGVLNSNHLCLLFLKTSRSINFFHVSNLKLNVDQSVAQGRADETQNKVNTVKDK